MKAPEKSLLIRIAKHIAKDEPTISDKEIKLYFQRILDDLPRGDLREKLLQNKKKHAVFLVRKVRNTVNKQQAETVVQNSVAAHGSEETAENGTTASDRDEPAEHGATTSHAHTDEAEESDGAADSRPTTTSQAAKNDAGSKHCPPSSPLLFAAGVRGQHMLQSEKYDEATGKGIRHLWSQIPVGVLGPDLAGLDRHCLMLMMMTTTTTDASCSPRILRNILHHCYTCLVGDLKDIQERSSTKRARKTLQCVEKFLRMVLERRSQFTEEATESPSVIDLLMAVVSVYLDLFVLAHRNAVPTSEQQKRMTWLVKQVLAGAGEKAMDAVLQMTAEVDSTAYFCPLVRYLLREKPAKRSHSHYLRYVLTTCMWRHLWTDMQDVVTEVRMLPAPKGFVDWLRRWNPEVSEELPSYRKFTGLSVTAFLLDDAHRSMLDMLLKAVASYEQGKMAATAVTDGEQQQEGASQAGSVKEARGKKKSEKKKVTVNEEEEADKKKSLLPLDDNDDAVDVSGDESEVEDSPAEVEVFDLTNFGGEEDADMPQSGDLFMIDRGGQQSADIVNTVAATKSLKKKKKKAEVAPVLVQENSENSTFFIDRGLKKKTKMQESDSTAQKLKKRKRAKLDHGARGDGEFRARTAEDDQETSAIASPGQSAASQEPKRKKKEVSLESSASSAAADSQKGFFIDRGEKAVSSPSREEPKKKKKKVSDVAGELPVMGLDSRTDQDEQHTAAVPALSNTEEVSEHSAPSQDVWSGKKKKRTSDSSLQEPGISCKKRSSGNAASGQETLAEQKSSNARSPLISPSSRSALDIAQTISTQLDKWSGSSSSSSPLVKSSVGPSPGDSLSKAAGRTAVSSSTAVDSVQQGGEESSAPVNESFVPDSFSEVDNDSEVVMVPDLHVHLKTQSPETNTSRKDSMLLQQESPACNPPDKSATTPDTAGRSPLSPTFSAETVGNRSGQKRKRKHASPRTAEEEKGGSVRVKEQEREETSKKSTSPTRGAKKRKSLTQEGGSSLEEAQKNMADTKSPPGTGRRKSSGNARTEVKTSDTKSPPGTGRRKSSGDARTEVKTSDTKSPPGTGRRKSSGDARTEVKTSDTKSPPGTGRRKSSGDVIPEAKTSESKSPVDTDKGCVERSGKNRSPAAEAEKEADVNRKESRGKVTPQDPTAPKAKTPKSTTPVSRRTRSQRKPVLPVAAQSPKSQEAAPQPAHKTAAAVSAKPSTRASDAKKEPSKPTSKKSKETPLIAETDPGVAKSTTSLKNKTPSPSKPKSEPVIPSKPLATSRRTSHPAKSTDSLYLALQKRPARHSMGPAAKSSPAAERRDGKKEKRQTEEKASFTKLKATTESSDPAQSSPQTPQAESKESMGDPQERGSRNTAKKPSAGKTSPSKSQSSSPLASGSPDRQTRSQSHRKGYNLRKSMKPDQ